MERFGKDSLADFDLKEIQEMYAYTFSSSPSFDTSNVRKPDEVKNKQQERNIKLSMFLRKPTINNGFNPF